MKHAVLFGHVIMIEGAPASSFLDASAHSMSMGGDTIADSELKLGGVDAASPMSTGVIMNIILAAIGFMVVFLIGFSSPPPVAEPLPPPPPPPPPPVERGERGG